MAEQIHAPYRGVSFPVHIIETINSDCTHREVCGGQAAPSDTAQAWMQEWTLYPTPRDEGFA